ncbi:hypothetical protein KDA23_07505 [Candidatus Saccharibacteria bacterium]|nr:hypothetical protein [Candidatus Saccharibacteria bacterium]
MHEYWQRQDPDKALFTDLIWSRPENRHHAGKLLIVGGNKYGFAAPAEAFSEAEKAGIGTARVLLPDSLYKTVGKAFTAGEFAPSTPSGSFARTALAELLAMAAWSDGVLLAGDLGRNSETAVLIEQFLQKMPGLITLGKDAVDYCLETPAICLDRPETTLIITIAQLQKLAANAKFTPAFTFDMDFLNLVEALHNFTAKHPANLVMRHLDNVFVAVNGQVSTTRYPADQAAWRTKTAAHAATWWLQNPTKPFEALTTATHEVL